ncbi:hypothetical protein AVEN_53370-1 [Araneus ventricosus]|uniref:Uncharacterized protein n=1 Tax=Araneus ventricosus TaxID=182803 RepID=A0A4Y2AAF4_ARAVE|nr:hypothetical protein AVEN_53370-1 [Araneus ventricosus]
MLVDELLESTVPIGFRLPRCSKMLAYYMNTVDILCSQRSGPSLVCIATFLFLNVSRSVSLMLEKRERESNLSLMQEYCRLSNAPEMPKDINTACFFCLRACSRRDVTCRSVSSADFPSLNPYCSGCWSFFSLIGS